MPALPEDGAVIVRALDVTDPTPNALAHQTASITDIEAALTMANGRPPSDMEISLLVQVARECDPAAQAQGYGPGTGSGLGARRDLGGGEQRQPVRRPETHRGDLRPLGDRGVRLG